MSRAAVPVGSADSDRPSCFFISFSMSSLFIFQLFNARSMIITFSSLKYELDNISVNTVPYTADRLSEVTKKGKRRSE